MTDDLRLLAIDAATLFRLDARGRIERRGDLDGGEGPRFWFAACASGHAHRLRTDVGAAAAAVIEDLVASEAAFEGGARPPIHADRYLELLAPVRERSGGPIYALPHAPAFAHAAPLVRSGSEAGEALRRALRAEGMPASLAELGFRQVSDLWDPWCVALRDGEPAAVCFAARLSGQGAEAGVATALAHRGKGLAAAATAGWAAHPDLASRALFYSTWEANIASQRVAERLGLRLLATSFSLT